MLETKADMHLLLFRPDTGAKVDAGQEMAGTADLHDRHLEIAVMGENMLPVRDVHHHENIPSANLGILPAGQTVENGTLRIRTNAPPKDEIPSASLADETMPPPIANDIPNEESLTVETDTRNNGTDRIGTNDVVTGTMMSGAANEIRNVETDTGIVPMRNDASLDIGGDQSVKMGNAGQRGDILNESQSLDVRMRMCLDDDVIPKVEIVGVRQKGMIGEKVTVGSLRCINRHLRSIRID